MIRPNIQELESFGKAMSLEGPAFLRASAAEYDSPCTYVSDLGLAHRKGRLAEKFGIIAERLEPIDSVMGADPEYPLANAFFRGSLLGIAVAHNYLSTETRSAIFEVKAVLTVPPQDLIRPRKHIA